MEPLGFPVSSTVSSANRDSLTSPTGVDTFSFPCLFPIVELPGLRGGHPCLVPAFRGEDFRSTS